MSRNYRQVCADHVKSAVKSGFPALQFAISVDLAQYFVSAVAEHGVQELIQAQELHYGKILFRASELELLKDYFSREVETGQQESVTLPDRYRPTKLLFWP